MEKFLEEFIENEDHVGNVMELKARAEAARRSMDGNRGSTERSTVDPPPRNKSLWTKLFKC